MSNWLRSSSSLSHRRNLWRACARALLALPAAIIGCGSDRVSNADAGVPADVIADTTEDADADAQAGCLTDLDCSERNVADASQPVGICFRGICFCRVQLTYVQRNGKCGSLAPFSCESRQGGECRRDASTCGEDSLEGDPMWASGMCDNSGTSLCCIPAASCRGPTDFVCCSASHAAHAPVCVNGWANCPRAFPTPASSCD